MGVVEEDREDFLDAASALDKAQEIAKAEWCGYTLAPPFPSLSN
jgi:hypothetical protein